MKVNNAKAIIACLGVAAAAAIAGSVSGTVAWFQYNTRVTAEYTGTTAKCTEFLQVRTVKPANGTVIKAKVADTSARDAVEDLENGDKVLVTADNKIYTRTAGAWDTPEAETSGSKVKVGETVYKFDGSSWSEITLEYGDWGTSLDGDDIIEAAGRANDNLKPVTAPGATVDGALPTLYGQPVCGYEKYADGEYKWQEAESEDYMQFQLQFRVLDVDGQEATPNALIATSLYLTDVTIAQATTVPATQDISAAVRVHMAHSTTYAHIGKGATDANISTQTHGSLDLNLDGTLDNTKDVPGANYGFNNPDPTTLDYGSDTGMGTSAAYSNLYDANGLYPTNDGYGHLTGGRPLGTTDGAAVPASDAAYFTVTFTIYLEGWQPLDVANASAATTSPAKTIWDSASYIGAKFNIGMSFGVTTLD